MIWIVMKYFVLWTNWTTSMDYGWQLSTPLPTPTVFSVEHNRDPHVEFQLRCDRFCFFIILFCCDSILRKRFKLLQKNTSNFFLSRNERIWPQRSSWLEKKRQDIGAADPMLRSMIEIIELRNKTWVARSFSLNRIEKNTSQALKKNSFQQQSNSSTNSLVAFSVNCFSLCTLCVGFFCHHFQSSFIDASELDFKRFQSFHILSEHKKRFV